MKESCGGRAVDFREEQGSTTRLLNDFKKHNSLLKRLFFTDSLSIDLDVGMAGVDLLSPL